MFTVSILFVNDWFRGIIIPGPTNLPQKFDSIGNRVIAFHLPTTPVKPVGVPSFTTIVDGERGSP